MNYTPHSTDEILINGCQRKNRLAQKYLYRRYYGQLLGICMRYTRDRDEAEEVLNTAFLKIFNNLDTYKDTGTLKGWMAKIVFNTNIDFIRKNTKYKQVMDFNEEKDIAIPAAIIQDLEAGDLYNAIQQLPDTNRVVFSLYVIEGYKHHEIADLLKININTAKWHLAEAKKKLRIVLRREMRDTRYEMKKVNVK